MWSSLRSLKNSTDAAGIQSSLWPSHLNDALLVTVPPHIIGLALDLDEADLSCGGIPCVSCEGFCEVNYGVTSILIVKRQSKHLNGNFGTLRSRNICLCLLGFCRFIAQNVCRCVLAVFTMQVEELQDACLACYTHIWSIYVFYKPKGQHLSNQIRPSGGIV